ncbi:MAG TPA: hypothetical protein VFP34_13795, partial [Microlunatus sp.]|nr:hypothetical protein [Microlunatus sp.]
DLLSQLAGADPQTKEVGDDTEHGSLAVRHGSFRVTVILGDNCEFLPGAQALEMPSGHHSQALARDQRQYAQLNRVLTTDLRIVCRAGGAFTYTITLP